MYKIDCPPYIKTWFLWKGGEQIITGSIETCTEWIRKAQIKEWEDHKEVKDESTGNTQRRLTGC